ncbi:MAG: double zinc ribbon domain-containing protein [Clostridia bacterium]|nr:double zinc ribbon domain-containing protein [Clostridia bacterium]
MKNKNNSIKIIKKFLRGYADILLSLIFPNRCIFCLELNSPFEDICQDCKNTLPWIDGEICSYCGALKDDCACSKRSGNYYDGIVAPLYYVDKVKNAIYDYKFNGYKNNGRLLAYLMAETCRKRYSGIKFDCVVCVPDDNSESKKEYSHCRFLAKLVAEHLDIPFYHDMLVKIYPTRHQRECPEIVRKGNLCGVFDVNSKYDAENKNILLVDDVKTTGSTLSECGKMLFLNGAAGVYCITAALGKDNKKQKTSSKSD